MKKNILLIFALCIACFVAKAQDKQKFVVPVEDFTQILVSDHINVEYHCRPDSSGYAVFLASPRMANQIVFTNNRKGKLSISVNTDSVYNKSLPKIILYSAYLESAENHGDSTLTVKSIAPRPNAKFKLVNNGSIVAENITVTKVETEILTGRGKIAVSGECTDLIVKNLGTGIINTEGLTSKNVTCRIMGTGKVYCNVNGGALSLSGTGTGKLYYHGTPASIRERQFGTIKAISLDESSDNQQ